MGKSHRDNFKARKKRGKVAFQKKAKRRDNSKRIKCKTCGTHSRRVKLKDGHCPLCLERMGITM